MGVRSSHARRKGTGRKARKHRIARIRVHKRHYRRYAGIKRRGGGSSRKPRVTKSGHKRRYFGRKKHTGPRIKYVRKGRHGPRKKGLHHKFKGRKKSAAKRHMRKGLKRHFKGRRKSLHRRVAKKGLHRKFKGRKASTHKRHVKPGLHRRFLGRKHRASGVLRAKKRVTANAITSSSYINMF